MLPRKQLSLLILTLAFFRQAIPATAAPVVDAAAAAWDTLSDTWVATDHLGRTVPGAAECGGPRAGRAVGIFYFLWLEGKGAVYDITKLTVQDPANPAYGPKGAFHFWGEPLFGYYRSDDPWVLRKHAQMLSDGGIDAVFFDVTNGFTYEQNYLALCRVFSEIRRLGQHTPQIAFLAHSHEGKVVKQLYDRFYGPGLHSDLWFRWQGKPLILANPAKLEPELRDFFTVRESWAWTDPKGWFGDGRDKWPWVDHTPQKPGWHRSPEHPEQVAVAVAQHPVSNIGRSFRNRRQPPPGQTDTDAGLYFDEQWGRALEVDPEFVFVTGWNEWVAQRFILNETQRVSMMGRRLNPGDTYFVDQYNREFSRDIEPMKGGHEDAYYYQMVGAIRRYKGAREVAEITSRPIRIDGRFEDWREVRPEFRDTIGDTEHRNHPGWLDQPAFIDQTGRNDLILAKVSSDGNKLFFYVRARQSLTIPCAQGWMVLFIDVDQSTKTGWLGYDVAVNRTNTENKEAIVEHFDSEQRCWRRMGKGELCVSGSELELAIPGNLLNKVPDPNKLELNFKWADNLSPTATAAEFVTSGDVAPNGRFNYRARFPASAQ